MDQNFEQFKKDFKRDLLIKIVVSLKHGNMSKPRAKQIAKYILQIFREGQAPLHQGFAGQARKVFERINKLAESHPDILDIFIKRMGEFDTRYKAQEIEQIHIYLKGGEIN